MRVAILTEDEIIKLLEQIEPAVDRAEKADLHYTAGRLKSAKNKLVTLLDERTVEFPAA